jgi:AdoMet-dependent heme synthase
MMHPHGTAVPEDAAPPLRLVAWEITRSCMLACKHCRAAAHNGPYQGEFSTDECMKVIDNLATMGTCIVILTGGEPMLREDIYEIARYGNSKGLRMVMAPCGMLLDEPACRKLIDAGIARISLSIDGATARSHDAFRGVPGAFDGIMRGMAAARASGLSFQVNTTVTRSNLAELPAIFKFAIDNGAVSFHPFLLVPTGRGKELTDEVISAVEYERTLQWIYEQQQNTPIVIKPTCAPHYYRIVRQEQTKNGAVPQQQPSPPHTHPHAHSALNATTKGCLGGQGFAFISHTGSIQICGFLPVEAGDLRKTDYDFAAIWKTSPLFNEVRAVDAYHGKCGWCSFNDVCGGCRARAYAVGNDYLGEEPYCLYTPPKTA